jgi:hypothetical protein
MRNHLLCLCAFVAVAGFGLADAPDAKAAGLTAHDRAVIGQIEKHRKETWRWQALMRKPRSPASSQPLLTMSPAYRSWVLSVWKQRAARARTAAQNPPRRGAWMCIHRHERHPAQGWRTRTGNGFYGGLQMNIAFQRTYGPELLRTKGTADRWLPIEQIWVAERAYRSGRGFYPWPNTARYCGLI